MAETTAEDAVRILLAANGVDVDDPRLADTPRRVAQTYAEFFAGVHLDPLTPLDHGDPVPEGLDLVTLRDLEFRSTCAHHLLPFSGLVHIAYIPARHIVGIGSIVRTLDILSTRPQLQENLTQELADALHDGAGAEGAVVVIEARHSCIADRGPREAASSLVTVAATGVFRDAARRSEALLTLRTPDLTT